MYIENNVSKIKLKPVVQWRKLLEVSLRLIPVSLNGIAQWKQTSA